MSRNKLNNVVVILRKTCIELCLADGNSLIDWHLHLHSICGHVLLLISVKYTYAVVQRDKTIRLYIPNNFVGLRIKTATPMFNDLELTKVSNSILSYRF